MSDKQPVSKVGRGRPAFDDREQILAYMTPQIDSGLSISQAVKGGLQICEFSEPGPDGMRTLHVVRSLNAQTLERRFRRLLEHKKAEFNRATAPFRREDANVIAIPVPVT